MDHLFQCINKYFNISSEAVESLSCYVKKVEIGKNSILVKESNICHQLYFLEKGALRGYYNLDSKEVTFWFAFEGSFITSFYSFISQKPGIDNIQAIENSILWSISYEALQKLFDQHHDIERLVRIINEKYYVHLEERLIAMQFRTARERYEQLILNSPHILKRISLGHIASYLGISQETLSRIRAQN